MPEEASKITIIADLLKRDPAYKEVVDQLEERLYNRYMVYLADKPRFNAKTQAIPKEYLAQILSFKNTIELNKVAKKHNLSQEQRDAIPAILWKIFWRDSDIKNLPQILNSEATINNIRIAYLLAGDIAQIYMPISDYLGDIPMVMKRWQFEIPAEPAISYQPSAISQPQPQTKLPSTAPFTPTAPTVPPIRPATPTPSSVIPAEAGIQRPFAVSQDDKKDESIARVHETMARISSQMSKIQPPPANAVHQQTDKATAVIQPKSDVEPEYLPDEKPTHSANIIDLKNF